MSLVMFICFFPPMLSVKLRWPCLETRFYDFSWQWQSTFNANFVWQVRTRTKVGIPLNFAAGDMDRLRIYSPITSYHVLAIRRVHPLTLTTRRRCTANCPLE